jgi:hypothetical protein
VSAVRAYGPDGRPVWVPVDDGAVGRVVHTRAAIRGPRGLIVASISPVISDPADEARREQLREAARRYRAKRRG